jgi:hypothetical protein
MLPFAGRASRRMVLGAPSRAPVAQLDRAVAFEATCRGFESLRAYSRSRSDLVRPEGSSRLSPRRRRGAFGTNPGGRTGILSDPESGDSSRAVTIQRGPEARSEVPRRGSSAVAVTLASTSAHHRDRGVVAPCRAALPGPWLSLPLHFTNAASSLPWARCPLRRA